MFWSSPICKVHRCHNFGLVQPIRFIIVINFWSYSNQFLVIFIWSHETAFFNPNYLDNLITTITITIMTIKNQNQSYSLYGNLETSSLQWVIHVFCLDFAPLEYIPTIPPHSTYVMKNLFCTFQC